MMTRQEIQGRLDELERELVAVDARRTDLLKEIGKFREALSLCESGSSAPCSSPEPRIPGSTLSAEERVRLFRELFHGREDVFPRRFESIKTGRSGYQPVCANEWRDGTCQKPKIKCAACDYRAFTPLSDDIVRCHLLGHDPRDPKRRDFTIGVYPLLEDETCWFLAVDFDKASWRDDAAAFGVKRCNGAWPIRDKPISLVLRVAHDSDVECEGCNAPRCRLPSLWTAQAATRALPLACAWLQRSFPPSRPQAAAAWCAYLVDCP